MDDFKFKSVSHDHDDFVNKALKRKGFKEAYEGLEEEYLLVREILSARSNSGLTQEEIASISR